MTDANINVNATDRTPDEWRDDILDAMVMHVPFDGWTRLSLDAAVRDLEIDPGLAKLAFPDGMRDVLAYYLARADRELEAALAQRGLDNMKIRDRITVAVRTRLELAEPHKEAVQRAVTLMALPQYAGMGRRALWRTCDIMWRAAGDTATDYNHYTKRAILSGVYSSTLLYWLNDTSPDHAETWAFLDRRIANVMQFEKVKAKVLNNGGTGPSLTRFLGRLRYGTR